MYIFSKVINGCQMNTKLNSFNLIAISGVRGAGKDSVTSMLQYCLSVPKIFRQYWIYKHFRKWISPKYKRLAFADPLKKMLAILLNIPASKFNDRHFKEDCVVNIPTLDFTLSAFTEDTNRLSDSKFNRMVKSLDPELIESNLTIRQLMQYFGTEICQKYFGRNVWINATLKHSNGPTIISDLRFKAEYEAIKKHNGFIIYVSRPGYWFGQHASEREMEELLNANQYDYVINNNGSVEDLFNKVKYLCNDK